MKNIITPFVFLWILAISIFAESDFSIVLYQPEHIISERVGGGVQEVASFIDVVKKIWKQEIPSDAERTKTSIVLGLGYGRQVKAWVMNSKTNINEKVTSELRKHKSPWIREGYFAFALSGVDYNSEQKDSFPLPIPKAWKAVAEKQSSPVPVDDILAVLLPKNPYPEKNVPEGYVIQLLEPLGGKILRPEGWYYSENHGGPQFCWIISQEDSSSAPYKTGMKIQMFAGIEKGTGKSPEEFCTSFLKAKADSTKVITEFPKEKQGKFTRQGIEVEEGPYHIIYSTFWMNSDIAVISISGTPKERWEEYKDTFQIMGGFELIDMERFANGSEPEH
ncbi:hypothetical protein EGM51_06865 [Verrucomicrobia bacterium S94]|nr:hypothetical protein EGM51_06865 [Verrucomicrobia bacterium S94]